MNKISLDQNKCIGCNTCPLMDPETFEMDTEIYKAKIKQQPTEITEAIKAAVAACPVGAISINEDQ